MNDHGSLPEVRAGAPRGQAWACEERALTPSRSTGAAMSLALGVVAAAVLRAREKRRRTAIDT